MLIQFDDYIVSALVVAIAEVVKAKIKCNLFVNSDFTRNPIKDISVHLPSFIQRLFQGTEDYSKEDYSKIIIDSDIMCDLCPLKGLQGERHSTVNRVIDLHKTKQKSQPNQTK